MSNVAFINIKPSKPHSIKIEDLDINRAQADLIENELYEFLSNLGFHDDRIEPLECRSRDGFIPYSHNKGGLGADAYRDQYSCCEDTGFENTDKTLEKYRDYDTSSFLYDKKIDIETVEWTEELSEELDEYRREDSEATVNFNVKLMLTSETTLDVNCYVDAKDAPYHRTFDDKFKTTIEFKSIAGLKQKLKRLEKNDFIRTLKQNLREAF